MNYKKRIVVFLLALIVCINIKEVPRASELGTAYLAKATSYYKHPITGVIEDAGNNEGLGQSMTESVLSSSALVEKTNSGKFYATVRIFLTDNISEVKFFTQKRGETSFKSVSATLMQENMGGTYCSDYRFAIPAEDAIVKASFYVTPMGRDVIFYFDFSNLKEGSGDFIVSVKQETKSQTTNQTVEKVNSEEKEQINSSSASTQEEKEESTSNKKTQEETKNEIDEQADTEEKSNQEGKEATTEKESVAGKSPAEQLLDQTQGLVLSDTSVLDTEEGSIENLEEVKETEKEAIVIPALSWTLVWQCILIITLPSLIIGGGISGILIFLKKREEE